MLPIILVLLFASSALTDPTVELILNNINEVAPPPSNGRLIGDSLLIEVFDTWDGGEKSVSVHYILNILAKIANSSNPTSQARALAGAVAILIELSTGYPGDACISAKFIDAYVNEIRSGNIKGARAAAASYVLSIVSGINLIVEYILNPGSACLATGRKGNCKAGGAVYQFEAAWDLVRSNAGSSNLLHEQYCAAKRLFTGFTAISRNVAAAATAAPQTHVAEAFKAARRQVAGFLAAVASGGPQVVPAARAAQRALTIAANNLV